MNKLIVKKLENKSVTDSGFILSDSDESLIQKTQILAVGQCKDTSLMVDQYAFITRTAGVEIDNNEWIIREDEVIYVELPEGYREKKLIRSGCANNCTNDCPQKLNPNDSGIHLQWA